jgi:hypothetical protein
MTAITFPGSTMAKLVFLRIIFEEKEKVSDMQTRVIRLDLPLSGEWRKKGLQDDSGEKGLRGATVNQT